MFTKGAYLVRVRFGKFSFNSHVYCGNFAVKKRGFPSNYYLKENTKTPSGGYTKPDDMRYEPNESGNRIVHERDTLI